MMYQVDVDLLFPEMGALELHESSQFLRLYETSGKQDSLDSLLDYVARVCVPGDKLFKFQAWEVKIYILWYVYNAKNKVDFIKLFT